MPKFNHTVQAFLTKISHFIDSNQLLSAKGLHLVALSGGPDSVALLRTLTALDYRVEAVHCNFHLRSEESDRDERFCEELCRHLKVPFHRVHFDTTAYAQLHHISIEMAARELRYRYFEQLRVALEADDICVGHHQDDNVETFLLNLLTGTGLHGLTGIKPRNGFIARPLLCVTRDEILDFLRSHNQDYVTDSTNLVADVKRNKLRLDILPMFQQVNSAASGNIARCIQRLAEAEKIYNEAVSHLLAQASLPKKENYEKLILDLNVVAQSGSPSTLLYEVLRPYNFVAEQVAEMLRSFDSCNKLWHNQDFEVLINDHILTVADSSAFGSVEIRVPEPGVYAFTNGQGEEHRLRVQVLHRNDIQLIRDERHCFLDFSQVHFPLILRNVRPGDRIVPLGMEHSRLVNDILAEKHLNLFQRRRQLVVEQADGSIVWIVNIRICHPCRVTDESDSILSISLE